MKNQFIEVFSEIAIKTFGDDGHKKESQGEDLATTIIYGLEALSEFAFECDGEKVYTMETIKKKFDPNTPTGKEVHEFMCTINTMIIQANRYIWDFQKISQTLQKMKDE